MKMETAGSDRKGKVERKWDRRDKGAPIMEFIFETEQKEEHGKKMGVGLLVIVVTPIEPYARLRPFLSVNG